MYPERSLVARPDAIFATAQSPVRFGFLPGAFDLEYIRRLMKRQPGSTSILHLMVRRMRNSIRSISVMHSIMQNIQYSRSSLDRNPENPKTRVDDKFLGELESYAKTLGIGAIGYTKLPRNLIFRELAVLYDNAIVLTMEMNAKKIARAPSQETESMIFETYDSLGIASNRLADFLRERGYAAQASHPLGGPVLYPPLAELASLGWHGIHGLLITPEFGSRVRLTAIYVDIENLPTDTENRHAWIQEFCSTCGLCVDNCPPNAIFSEPIIHEGGSLTHMDVEKCIPYFAEYYGCTICIKVCPFSKGKFEQIKKRFYQGRS